MNVPAHVNFPPADYLSASFEATVLEFTEDAYVGIAAAWFAADIRPNDTYALATTLAPEQISRVEKGTNDILTGKSIFQTPEPPAIVMVLIGLGLIFAVRGFRTVHRAGRRRVRAESRKMARI